MAWKVWRLDHPAGWIALGAVVLLASPKVRKALRSATVAGAVSVLKLGDGIKDMGSKMNHETRDMVTEARNKRDAWRSQEDTSHWVRDAVVKGVATTMNAAETITEGAKNWYQQVRTGVSTEVGEMGATQKSAANLLPEHLLPQSEDHQSLSQHDHNHVPGDFAVRRSDMMSMFRDDVIGVGAEFKPEYQRMADLIRPHTD